MDIVNCIEKEVKEKIEEYKKNAEDHFDYWNEQYELNFLILNWGRRKF